MSPGVRGEASGVLVKLVRCWRLRFGQLDGRSGQSRAVRDEYCWRQKEWEVQLEMMKLWIRKRGRCESRRAGVVD